METVGTDANTRSMKPRPSMQRNSKNNSRRDENRRTILVIDSEVPFIEGSLRLFRSRRSCIAFKGRSRIKLQNGYSLRANANNSNKRVLSAGPRVIVQ